MSIEVLLLLATAVLAVVAVVAALVAVRAVRRLNSTPAAQPDSASPQTSRDLVPFVQPGEPTNGPTEPMAPLVRVVEGRVVSTPTQQQVVAAALGRPAARVSIYAAGLMHALRPESRDRIQALMRREFRRRRRVRQRVARRAARSVPAQNLHPDETWLGGSHTTKREYPRVVGE